MPRPTRLGLLALRLAGCGDGLGKPHSSEVLDFDAGDRLLATAAVFWVGTKIVFSDGNGFDVGGEPEPDPDPDDCA